MNQKYMIYMYLLKARTFIALLLVIAFFSVMVPNFLTASNLLIDPARGDHRPAGHRHDAGHSHRRH